MSSVCENDSVLDKLKELTEKNRLLEEENEKLSQELQIAVHIAANLCERVINLDLKCERLETRLDDLKKDTGVDFNILSSRIDVNSNPELKEQKEKLRLLAEKLNSEKVESEELITEQEEDVEQSDSLPETPDSRAISKEHDFRQAETLNNLYKLIKLLEKKEMTQNNVQMKKIRKQNERKKRSQMVAKPETLNVSDLFTDLSDEDCDNRTDEDFIYSPILKKERKERREEQRKKKPPKCFCRTGCRSRLCGCKRSKIFCTQSCKCDSCRNKNLHESTNSASASYIQKLTRRS